MNVLNKLAHWATKKGYLGQVDSSFFMSGLTLQQALANTNTGNVSNAYRQECYVYSAIYSCAVNLAQVPFRFYTGTDLGRDVVEVSPYDALFESPNPFMSRFQLWEATEIYLKLRGECMWVLEGGGIYRKGQDNIPAEIYPMDPSLFEPVIDKESGLIAAWVLRGKGNEKVILENDTEVIQFKKFNPYDRYRGLSPLEAAARSVKMGQSVRQINDSILDNGSEPGGVLTSDQALTPEQMRQIREQFEQRHTGAANTRRLAILHSGLKYQQIALSPSDMAFANTSKMSLEDILSVLRVPKTEVFHYEDIRRESSEIQDRALWTKNLVPEMMYLEDVLQARFFSKRGPRNMWGLFDISQITSLQDTLGSKVDTAQKFFAMGWPLNEINKLMDLGFQPVSWGDVGYLPFNLIPATQVGDAHAGAPSGPSGHAPSSQPGDMPSVQPGDAQPAQQAQPAKQVWREIRRGKAGHRWIERKYVDLVTLPARPGSSVVTMGSTVLKLVDEALHMKAAMTSEQRAVAWRMFERAVKAIEGRYEKKLQKWMFTVRQRTLDRLFTRKRSTDDPLFEDLDAIFAEEILPLKKLTRPFVEEAQQVGQARIAALGINFNMPTDRMETLASEQTGRIRGIADTIERQLREQLTDGIQSGESVTELAGRLRSVFNMASSRALTIARTELVGAANQASLLSMSEAKVLKVQWVTAGDELVRETHVAQDGDAVETGHVFKNGLTYPGEQTGDPSESINCRCTLVPVV